VYTDASKNLTSTAPSREQLVTGREVRVIFIREQLMTQLLQLHLPTQWQLTRQIIRREH